MKREAKKKLRSLWRFPGGFGVRALGKGGSGNCRPGRALNGKTQKGYAVSLETNKACGGGLDL